MSFERVLIGGTLVTPDGVHPGTLGIRDGRIESGRLKTGATVQAMSRMGERLEQFRVSKILAFRGLSQQPIDEAEAGDIVAVGAPIGYVGAEGEAPPDDGAAPPAAKAAADVVAEPEAGLQAQRLRDRRPLSGQRADNDDE